MTYPLSNEVSSGQPTAYQHYNNLRADALRFGQAAADSANLGALLARFEHGLTLEYLETNRLRVPASPAAPVGLVINGCLLSAAANVDLSAGAAPSGAAALYYVFAVRSPGSATFTLDINTAEAESANTRRIGRFYWDGSAVARASITTEAGLFSAALIGFLAPQTCGGRLSLVSGSPLPGSATGGTLYFTPFNGSRAALYAPGYGWRVFAFSELSLSLAGRPADKNFDVFLAHTGGALALELVQWSNDSTRAVDLAWLDGALVKNTDAARRYLGTLRTSAAGECADEPARRYLYNHHNRLPCRLFKGDATSHTYASTTRRYWNNDSSLWFGLVLGQEQAALGMLDAQTRLTTGSGYSDVQMVLGEPSSGSGLVAVVNLSSAIQRCGNTVLAELPAGFSKVSLTEMAGSSTTMSNAFAAVNMLVWM